MYNPVFASEALARKEKIQAALRRLPADALLLADNANLYYTSSRVFCGYTYVPAEGDMIYFVRRPVGLAGDNVVYIRKPEQIIEEMQKRGLPLPQTLLVEGDSLSYNEYTRLASAFPSSRILPGGTALIRQVRAVKTPFEIGMIRQSAASHDMLYRHIPKLYTPGMTDLEFSIEIERAARQHGSLGIFRIFGRSMEIFMGNVLAGENADTPTPYDFAMGGAGLDDSLPIGCNGTTIHPGQTVMVDVNGNFTGYMTDLSRVYSLGEIPEKARHAHAVSLEIEQAVMSMARPGVAASELYDKALAIARDRKVEDYFMGHRQKAGFVGHGVGIEINEQPVLAPRSRDVLEAGMVFALEPKFVIPGVGPVGIENTFLVTDDGVERLTNCEEEIRSLD
ncbi:MAG TPA: aminopeptidase P family protein [Candidatus Caccoplasma merdavium]|nr:aminopeptidase P family protein [Candidatus Caccoplasma merdavium]